MFGAAGCSRDPTIDKLNIIFGTQESNTDMLRAELSVTRYLTKYSLSIGDPDPPAFIYTSNVRQHEKLKSDSLSNAVHRIGVDGSRSESSIPDWVAAQRYRMFASSNFRQPSLMHISLAFPVARV